VARVLAAVSRSAGGDGGGVFVLLLIAVAIVAPWIAPFDAENYFDYDRLNDGPSMMHWFGVDSLGRDIFSRVLVGAQISLAAGVLAVFIGAAIGTVLGLLAGYYEGWWDRIIMRICDVLFAFPGILLAIAVVAVMGAGCRTSSSRWRSFRSRLLRVWCAAIPWCLSSRPLLSRRAASAPAMLLSCLIIFCPERYHR
jgi:ABC-type dipeptide/oligopeptide/nickel transport system permease subunit